MGDRSGRNEGDGESKGARGVEKCEALGRVCMTACDGSTHHLVEERAERFDGMKEREMVKRMKDEGHGGVKTSGEDGAAS